MLLIEILVALAFMAVVAGVALKMHQASLDYNRDALQRLRGQLVVENVAEQLTLIPYEELSDSAAALAEQSATEIVVDPFESGAFKGLHLVVRIQSTSGPLEHHAWRLEPQS